MKDAARPSNPPKADAWVAKMNAEVAAKARPGDAAGLSVYLETPM